MTIINQEQFNEISEKYKKSKFYDEDINLKSVSIGGLSIIYELYKENDILRLALKRLIAKNEERTS